MKKVLIIGMTPTYGGMESFLMNYINNIKSKNIQFDYLVNYFETIAYEQKILDNNSKIYRIHKKRKHYFKYKKEIKNFFKQHAKEYYAIWVNCCRLVNIDYLKLAKKYGIKVRILHSHANASKYDGFINNIYSKLSEYKNKQIENRYVTNHWACSDSAAIFMFNKNIIRNNNYTIINNAIDMNKFKFDLKNRKYIRDKLGYKKNDIIIGHIGRFSTEKNHIYLLEVFNKLVELNDNYKLLLIGDGNTKNKIIEYINKNNLTNKVTLLNSIIDIYKYYSAMDLFIFPSMYEGLGMTLIEAQVNGLKCITSNRVPQKTKISDNIEYLSLDKDKKNWINTIKNSTIDRKNNYLSATKAGFDIKLEAKKLKKFFEE